MHHRDTLQIIALSLDILMFAFHPWEWINSVIQFLHCRPMKVFKHMTVVNRNLKGLVGLNPRVPASAKGFSPNRDVDLTNSTVKSIYWFKGHKMFRINRQLGCM